VVIVRIRFYESGDYDEWLRMRRTLWPELVGEDEARDAREWSARSDAVVIVAQGEGCNGLVGFAELGVRSYADGCDSSPVAFLEGWYVDEAVRRQGIGSALVRAGQEWARLHGLRELASDALLDNEASHKAHAALGFVEVERTVKFRKAL